MWNPPLVDERTGARASALGEAADLLADLVESETRTICFLRSRRGVELIQQFTKLRLEDRGRADLAERIAPYRAGYTPIAAARDRAAAGGRRAAGRGDHRRAGAGHRRRRAGRRHLRDLPGHRGQPAPDVGPRRAAQHRPGAVRGRRRRAGPVLLPPPRRVPGPAGGVGHPRPRVRGDLPGPPVRRRLRAAAVAGRRGVPGRPLGAGGAAAGAAGPAARARRALPAARRGLPRRPDRPALLVAGLGGGGRGRGRRGDRLGGDRARARRRARRLDLPAHGPLLRGRAAGPGQPPRARAPPSPATSTPSPRRRPTPSSRRWSTAARWPTACCPSAPCT